MEILFALTGAFVWVVIAVGFGAVCAVYVVDRFRWTYEARLWGDLFAEIFLDGEDRRAFRLLWRKVARSPKSNLGDVQIAWNEHRRARRAQENES